MSHKFKVPPFLPFNEGDYSGRGTWADPTIRYCQFRYRYGPDGKKLGFPGHCIKVALPGLKVCSLHKT